MIKTVKTSRFEMDYLQFGKGNKPFVILPGLSIKSVLLSAEAIEQAFSSFTEDFTVYLFDRTKQLPEHFSIGEMAKDTLEAIHSLKLQDIFLFGASQGGMIALTIAETEPMLIKKLVVSSSASRIHAQAQKKIDEWVLLAEKAEIEKLNASFIDSCYSEEFAKKYKPLLMEAMKDVSENELKRFLILAKSCGNFNAYTNLEKIVCPVLVTGSINDKVLSPDSSIEIAEKLHCKIHMYKEFGHASYDEAPDFKENMLKFFSE